MKLQRLLLPALGLCLLGMIVLRPASPRPPGDRVVDPPRAPARPFFASRPARAATLDAAPLPAIPPPNLFQRAMKDYSGANGVVIPKLSAGELEPFLTQNHRSAASLLAAFHTSGEPIFLQEAWQTNPDDPRVAMTAIFQADITPEEKQRRVDKFRETNPDNALANYLGALQDFKAGRPAQALAQLQTAAGTRSLRDYSADFMQSSEEAYQTAGYSQADAATAAAIGLPQPYLPELKALGRSIGDLAAQYRQAGDQAAAQATLQMGLEIGQRLDSGSATMMQDIVGLTIQRNLLAELDPTMTFGGGGQTIQNQIDLLTQQRTALQTLATQQVGAVSALPDDDVVHYFQRMKASGETAALRWAVAKIGGQ